jgi:hypothetical protein
VENLLNTGNVFRQVYDRDEPKVAEEYQLEFFYMGDSG